MGGCYVPYVGGWLGCVVAHRAFPFGYIHLFHFIDPV